MYDLKVYLTEEAKVQLEDDFVDKEDDLRHFVYEQIKKLAKQAGMIVLNKQFVANLLDEDKQTKQETIKLKEFNLDKFALKSDATWLPENMEVCRPEAGRPR